MLPKASVALLHQFFGWVHPARCWFGSSRWWTDVYKMGVVRSSMDIVSVGKSCHRLSLTWPEDGGHVFTCSSKHSRSSPCAHSERHRHHPHQDVHTACVQRLGPLFAAACKRVPLRVFSRPPPPPIRRAQPGLIPLGLQFGMPTSQASPPVRDVVGSYCT